MRIPLAGEDVQTPEGPGIILSTIEFGLLPASEQRSMFTSMRAMFGDDFRNSYFRASVKLDNGNVKSFEAWEVEYDSERDIEDAPWREPRSDS